MTDLGFYNIGSDVVYRSRLLACLDHFLIRYLIRRLAPLICSLVLRTGFGFSKTNNKVRLKIVRVGRASFAEAGRCDASSISVAPCHRTHPLVVVVPPRRWCCALIAAAADDAASSLPCACASRGERKRTESARLTLYCAADYYCSLR